MQAVPIVLGGSTALLTGTAMHGIMLNSDQPTASDMLGFFGSIGLAAGVGAAHDLVRRADDMPVTEARLGAGIRGMGIGVLVGSVVGGVWGIAQS